MNAPQRYIASPTAPQAMYADGGGDLVLFADIEPALRDADRFKWLLPVIAGNGDHVTRIRAQALADGLTLGLTGSGLVDFARRRCPA
jgi:hypothetical protein